MELIKDSADSGCADAQFAMGTMLDEGNVYELGKDLQKAFDYFEKSEQNGNKLANFQILKLKQRGIGAQKIFDVVEDNKTELE